MGIIGWRGRATGMGRQYNLSRRSATLVADDEDIVTRAIQKLGNDIARRTWPVGTKDSLVLAETLDLCAGID